MIVRFVQSKHRLPRLLINSFTLMQAVITRSNRLELCPKIAWFSLHVVILSLALLKIYSTGDPYNFPKFLITVAELRNGE